MECKFDEMSLNITKIYHVFGRTQDKLTLEEARVAQVRYKSVLSVALSVTPSLVKAGRRGAAYSFLACLSHLTIDHASLSRRRAGGWGTRMLGYLVCSKENTWKCGELKLYFSPSAGG